MAACNIEEYIKLYKQGNKSSTVMWKPSCLTIWLTQRMVFVLDSSVLLARTPSQERKHA